MKELRYFRYIKSEQLIAWVMTCYPEVGLMRLDEVEKKALKSAKRLDIERI
jgi:hypothetical protein